MLTPDYFNATHEELIKGLVGKILDSLFYEKNDDEEPVLICGDIPAVYTLFIKINSDLELADSKGRLYYFDEVSDGVGFIYEPIDYDSTLLEKIKKSEKIVEIQFLEDFPDKQSTVITIPNLSELIKEYLTFL